ncbi:DEAD/DEAH box helicase [Flammeovirga kamogawensis]|uniref:DEAD/DEAH box helicase n=1 Tax=Flammeovirga kamogawensis TaxID=373891 RepID=A0ABX8GUH2_9BACT|nr:DEAD/DEAH box helicase [Flammeovirga kamogawensis]MBB6459878.1 ATP-dependent RNA helicase DeaD [Flammeovirga kamogawensis]QWG07069.1 DEAD/DEAH box helicase [Flammeovirga kamogawensis]TRX68890.1 DEAD/DEAH box helicase [Flammeovirga kamogawensis]
MTFKELGIQDALIKALKENGIEEPTAIQEKSIPFLITKGTDFIGQAQTGTGKTAAFGLPLLQAVNPKNSQPQALVLSPTRELGQQIQKQLFRFTKYYHKVFCEAVYGGASIDQQINNLKRPTHIVVATPGRLLDLVDRNAIDLSGVKTVVMDEADEMLSMGFKEDLSKILRLTTNKKATWLFSATFPAGINEIVNKHMDKDAFRIEVNPFNVINKKIKFEYILAEQKQKIETLNWFIRTQGDARGVVFTRTKAEAQQVSKQLHGKQFKAEAIHGDLSQKERDKVMRAFKGNKLQILVATDLAARGIDIADLAYVVHYQLPDKMEYFTHRSGRTARAGKSGTSLCIVTKREMSKLDEIEDSLGITMEQVFD